MPRESGSQGRNPDSAVRGPVFRGAVRRTRLVKSVLGADSRLVFISAASGYGKSVLASQIAQDESFDDFIWVSAAGVGDAPALVRVVVSRLESAQEAEQEAGALLLMPSESSEEPNERLLEAASAMRGCRVCLVIDDARLQSIAAALPLLREATRALGEGSRMIVTSRADPGAEASGVLNDAMILGAEELRLAPDEIAAMAASAGIASLAGGQLDSIREASSGHAALTDLLIRHHDLGWTSGAPCVRPSHDVLNHARYLAFNQLQDLALRVFYACSLLQRGTLADLRDVVADADAATLSRVAECIPLVRKEGGGTLARFTAHDLAYELCVDTRFSAQIGDDFVSAAREKVLAVLLRRADWPRLFDIVARSGVEEELVLWLEGHGESVLADGHTQLLSQLVASVGPAAQLAHPRMLLLECLVMRQTVALEDALMKVRVARRLAESIGEQRTVLDSLLVQSRLEMDVGRLEEAADSLDQAMRMGAAADLDANTRALAHAYLGSCLVRTGTPERAEEYLSLAMQGCDQPGVTEDVRAVAYNALSVANGPVRGRWDLVLPLCSPRFLGNTATSLQVQFAGNRATILTEMGRVDQSAEELRTVLASCNEHGLRALKHSFESTVSCNLAAAGAYTEAARMQVAADSGYRELGDTQSLAQSLCSKAVWLRASDAADTQALVAAERALELASSLGQPWLRSLARLELSASMLALGESSSAVRGAQEEAQHADQLGAHYHALRADMIRAEIARRDGRPEEGAALLAAHRDYILTESSNWQIAMYCRAFPELLGLFAVALGPDELPVHLTRMILPENAERTLVLTRDFLDEELWHALGRRLLGADELDAFLDRDGRPLCRVRLFGGLEVNVGGRTVRDSDWKKRKARLLFAMLVIRQGQDVPRDQLLEHLWPDMSEARAKNNLYVVWSAMKGALVGAEGKGKPLPYVENVGGMCRIVRDTVRSDAEEFEQTIGAARTAEDDGRPEEALKTYRRLAEIYRGDLLPGDLYDDWFSALRDHYRGEFVDATVRAAKLADDAGDMLSALQFIRRAIQADSWREDLYQQAIRYQIASGQRGAAIETYMQCKSRLAEDLGLDPSTETRELYGQILAMEEGPSPEYDLADD